MEAYKRWVRRNRGYVHSLDSLANGLTWLLPDSILDSEIVPEAVTSILGIITTVNEHIIETNPTTQTPVGSVDPPSFRLSLSISLFTNLETLIEVAAEQFYGEEKKWDFMAITEAIKVLLRLGVLRDSGYKMLLDGGESLNDTDDSDNLEGRAVSALSRFGESARMGSEPTWLLRVQRQQAIMDPPTKTHSLSTFLSEKGIPGGLFLTGDVMSILRPLLYLLLIRRYGVRSWFPWLTSLGVDFVGNGIIPFVTNLQYNRKDLSNLDKSELKRRKLLWAFYLMRDPFFTKYTWPRLDGTQKILEPIPIIGILTEKLIELVVGAQTRYTYMSGS